MEIQKEEGIPKSASPESGQTVENEAAIKLRKHQERIKKLRNLSFNTDRCDFNNEFENVPDYIRRNMELYNLSVQVKNYSIKGKIATDENGENQLNAT